MDPSKIDPSGALLGQGSQKASGGEGGDTGGSDADQAAAAAAAADKTGSDSMYF